LSEVFQIEINEGVATSRAMQSHLERVVKAHDFDTKLLSLRH
jgi:hypothetical protein